MPLVCLGLSLALPVGPADASQPTAQQMRDLAESADATLETLDGAIEAAREELGLQQVDRAFESADTTHDKLRAVLDALDEASAVEDTLEEEDIPLVTTSRIPDQLRRLMDLLIARIHFETLRDAYASVYEMLTGQSYETSLNAAPQPGLCEDPRVADASGPLCPPETRSQTESTGEILDAIGSSERSIAETQAQIDAKLQELDFTPMNRALDGAGTTADKLAAVQDVLNRARRVIIGGAIEELYIPGSETETKIGRMRDLESLYRSLLNFENQRDARIRQYEEATGDTYKTSYADPSRPGLCDDARLSYSVAPFCGTPFPLLELIFTDLGTGPPPDGSLLGGPLTVLGSPLVAQIRHQRLIGHAPTAEVGDFDGGTIDLNYGGETWEAITGFQFGAQPWIAGPGTAPRGQKLNGGFFFNRGSADQDFQVDTSDFAVRDLFPLGEGNPTRLDDAFFVDRDGDVTAWAFSGLYGSYHPVPFWPKSSWYGQVQVEGFGRNTEFETSLRSFNETNQTFRDGFLNENIETFGTNFGGGIGLVFPLADRLFGDVGLNIGGTYLNSSYNAANCFSQVAGAACDDRVNTAFNEDSIDLSESGFALSGGANLGLNYYFDSFAIGIGGGVGTRPGTKVDYPNGLGETPELRIENQVTYQFGTWAKVRLDALFN